MRMSLTPLEGIERKLPAGFMARTLSGSFDSHSARKLASCFAQDDRIKSCESNSRTVTDFVLLLILRYIKGLYA